MAKQKDRIIKSTKTTLNFTNQGKLKQLYTFIDEYRLVVKQFIDLLWPATFEDFTVYSYIPKKLYRKITNTWLTARAIQAAGQQAAGIIKSTADKQKKRWYVYNKLLLEEDKNKVKTKLKQARKLKAIIDRSNTKPDINTVEPQLDSRFIKHDWKNPTTFDGVITFGSLGYKNSISIPIKKSKHFNDLLAKGKLLTSIRLSKKNLCFAFDLPVVTPKNFGQAVGLDIGVKNTYTLSTGISSQPDIHNHTLDSINKKLARKRKGSNAFGRTQLHRTNYINWSLNQIDFSNISAIKAEDIKYLRRGKKTSRYLSHFTYTEVIDKLEDLCIQNGVQIEYVNPTYTSQRCSCCGWVRSKNRKGKQFKCSSCGFALDADLNASRNILAALRPISSKERLLNKNRKGFYWN